MSVTIRNKIIEELFKSKDFNDCIKKMQPVELQEDLRSEVTLTLLELEQEKLISIYNTGGLKYYAVRIILNSIQSKTSPFFKKYRKQFVEFNDAEEQTIKIDSFNPDEEEEGFSNRLAIELREQRVLDIIDQMYWYDKELVKLYIELGSYRNIQIETGIPWRSCYDTIQSAISKIKYELRKNTSVH